VIASGAATRLPSVAALILVPALVSVPTAPKDQTIVVTENANSVVLTVPVSRLMMTIPGGDLKRVTVDAHSPSLENPRYFQLRSTDRSLIVSGWFEPDREFDGLKKLWAGDIAVWKKEGDPEPTDVSFEKVGSWDAVVYELALADLVNSHIRASRVQAGTWIDVHLSLTTDRPAAERRQRLRETLAAIQVAEKK
jgi:hypothetical protein